MDWLLFSIIIFLSVMIALLKIFIFSMSIAIGILIYDLMKKIIEKQKKRKR
jgi:hypothetical protein